MDQPRPNDETAKTTESAEVTGAGLAELWCFQLTRKRLGSPRDSPLDMRAEFEELIRLGKQTGNPRLSPEKLRDSIMEPGRDRGEHFWQFKARLLSRVNGHGPPRAPASSSRTEHRFKEPGTG